MGSRQLGEAGETAAAGVYADSGYSLLARNWRCRHGEIDLILERAGCLVFCEVKTRTSAVFGSPAEAVTPMKRARLRKLAAIWLAENPAAGRRDVRFDVAEVAKRRGYAPVVQIIEAAF